MIARLCFAGALALFLGCNTGQVNPTATIGGLVGKIEPKATRLSVGEDLIVDYWISSLDAQPIELLLSDGSKDPEQPFQGYTFNAVLADDPRAPMDPVFIARPLLGRQTLDPRTPVRFQRIRWRPRRPGTYKLTFVIEWRKDQIIAFDPATVQVAPRRLPTEKTPIEVKPETSEQVSKLMAELAGHLQRDAWRKRAAIKLRIRNLGASATLPLLAHLGSPRQELRMETTSLMIDFGRQAIPALLRGCEHDSPLVRYRSAFALGKIREAQLGAADQQAVGRAAGPPLVRLARQDADIQVRYVALDMLVQHFETRGSVPALLDGLSDREVEIRQACNRWLKRLSGSDVGFDPKAGADERAAGVERWRKLWKSKLQ